jgi:carboxymethylenebutenolidase
MPTPEVEGHLATPPGDGPWPGLVVVHELFGLTDDVRAVTDRLAGHGYLSYAVDLYAAGNTVRCLVSAMREVISGQGGAILERVEAARQRLLDHPDCTGKVGVIGFCMGGGFAILAAGRYDFDVAAPAYGDVPDDVERALSAGCPIVASYGAKDRRLRGAAARLDDGLARLGIEHDVKEYPDAGHGFMGQYTGRWAWVERMPGMGGSPAARDDAWRRTLDFLDRHLN